MQFVIDGNPIAKARHRTARTKWGVKTYDPQSEDKDNDRWRFMRQMRENGLELAPDGPLHLDLRVGIPYPKKMAQKRRNEQFVVSKPDLDNYVKYYSDVMNGIVYRDDNAICSLYAEKRYTSEPCTEVIIIPLGGTMVNEHAITVRGEITPEDLEYIVKKANKLGKSGRNVVRVFSQEDGEGRHIYFETEGLLPKRVDQKPEML